VLSSSSQQLLRQWLIAQGIPVNDDLLCSLSLFYRLILIHNRRFNLTRIVEEGDFVRKHLIDSLSVAPLIIRHQIHSLIDVGSGAGFPGIPLKVVLPTLRVLLLDASRKKVLFLEEVIRELNLGAITTRWDRAELAARHRDLRESFDAAVARALKELRVTAELTLPFVRIGGILIAQKGPGCTDEIESAKRALSILGGNIESLQKLSLPDESGERILLTIRKVKPCPEDYPRRPGLPEKRPL